MFRGGDFGSKGGNIGQKFINDFRSSPVLQWRRKNFCSGERIFSKNVLIIVIKDLENFEKFIKNLHKNLINSPKFFKNKILKI